jgi:hypothetical protein
VKIEIEIEIEIDTHYLQILLHTRDLHIHIPPWEPLILYITPAMVWGE